MHFLFFFPSQIQVLKPPAVTTTRRQELVQVQTSSSYIVRARPHSLWSCSGSCPFLPHHNLHGPTSGPTHTDLSNNARLPSVGSRAHSLCSSETCSHNSWSKAGLLWFKTNMFLSPSTVPPEEEDGSLMLLSCYWRWLLRWFVVHLGFPSLTTRGTRALQKHFASSPQSSGPAYQAKASRPVPSQPHCCLQRRERNIPYVSFVSNTPIESTATRVSPLRRRVRLFMGSYADVRRQWKNSQTTTHFHRTRL